MHEFVLPPALEPGDSVAVIAPGTSHASLFPHVYELGLDRLESEFGLTPVEFPTATKSPEWLYDHPAARAEDVMDAFADPDIAGVIAVIGGADQVRILPHLDTDVLRENPTRFYGTSDNTNLQTVLWNEGVVSFYGGTLFTEFAMEGSMHDYTVEYLKRAMFEESFGELRLADRFTDENLDWADPNNLEKHREMEPNPGWQWRGGTERVTGRTWGGCLSVVDQQLSVDRYLPAPSELDGAVLLLETSEELPSEHDVRWMLMGMGERGLLSRFSAVLVGRAKARSHEVARPPDERAVYRERQRDAIADLVAEYNPDAPVVFDLDFGHTAPVAPVPVGGEVTVDPESERIQFEY
ncbi:peptidase U61 LD-carboxypeptidase A [Haladaptatus paucihalophilus DX253]|uniref:Muramoyltetrapeptide carboxypeptidase LdcA (Peptidoglycan recycling) n=1 Tax=Haladaptatus paucihalophilus DX253 TaxID=797209 RepID=E7QX60_HALPU|nr:S66 peptidase family protein [Haladaptatus paucihalophilus]EFW90863.1 peptidase U61 LD-carboxypeptidase A [Haladaptatus paucihalophilus DX253]SHK24272.1 Muramoyltetrapeptide carboxypeptidase LdcA (peptidoglycan recycling) [Haladaptatus paucihalophilus DX253]